MSQSPTDISIRKLAPGEAAGCEGLLRSLPRWFAIEQSISRYARDVGVMETYVADASGRMVGFITLHEHNAYSTEIHVMAVAEGLHRQGIGRRLVAYAEAELRRRATTFFHVKTRGPSTPDPDYEKTRAFYHALGFRPLEETTAIWGEDDPCLILVKAL